LSVTPVLAQRQRVDRAFERLYRKHAADVYRYALVVLRNQADAEDVTQTTFLNAYRAFERGERPRAPQNWLIAIAHNVCRQRFRQTQRRPSEVAFEEDLAEAVVDEDAISAEDIRRALGHLAFNQRSALVMRELEGRSYQEIADILGVTTSAVETLIFRARRALREQLEGGLTCHEAERAISLQLDGRLPRKERGALRAHLRECEECAHFARSQRAQRGALKSLGLVPLPQSLASLFGGGGGTAVGGGLAVKAAAVGAGAIVASGVGYEGVKHGIWRPPATASAHRTSHSAASTPQPAATLPVSTLRTIDQQPYRPRAVKARSALHAQAKKAVPALVRPSIPPGLAKPKPVAKEVSPLPPSRDRGLAHRKPHPAKKQHTPKTGHTPKTRHTPKTPPPTSKRHQNTPPPKKHEPPAPQPKPEPKAKAPKTPPPPPPPPPPSPPPPTDQQGKPATTPA
jgi:RNA polymerase sigma factor (sigma-70 family)